MDGAPSDRLRRLAADYAKQWMRGNPDQAPANSDFSGVSGKLFHHRRRLSDGELLFAVNASLDAPARATVRLPGKSVTRLDPFTGKTEPYPARAGKNGVSVSVELPPGGQPAALQLQCGRARAAARAGGPGAHRWRPPAPWPSAASRPTPSASITAI